MAKGTLYICVPDTAPPALSAGAPGEAAALRDALADVIGPALMAAGLGRAVGTARVAGRFGGADGKVADFSLLDKGAKAARHVLASVGAEGASHPATAAVFETDDLMLAEYIATGSATKAGLGDRYAIHREVDPADRVAETGAVKTLEVYYDIASVPGGFGDPFTFRNAAMTHIEEALETAGAGEWAGAESGRGEVSFGFEVEDFDRAERILRAAVEGTPFEGIRELTRYYHPAGVIAAE